MTRQFIVPNEADILSTLGADSEPVEGEDTIRVLRFTADKDDLAFTYDITARTVTIEWSRDDMPLIDMTRAGAVLMRVEWVNKQGTIYVDFDTNELGGSLALRVHPTIVIEDMLLFR